MNYKYILMLLVFTLACGNSQTSGNSLARLGFYSSPDEIINELKHDRASAAEHFMLGLAYKEKKKYKNALHHFSNSCFEKKRNEDLKLFASPVYQFVTGFYVKSPYFQDALFEIARLFYYYREYEYVIKFVEKMAFQKNILCRDAFLLKAKAESALNRNGEAVKTLERLRNEFGKNDTRYIIHIRLASAYRQTEQYSSAVKEYLKVLEDDIGSWQSSLAARELSSSLDNSPIKLTDREYLNLSRALFRSGKHDRSLQFMGKIDKTKKHKKEITELTIRNLTRLNKTAAVNKIVNGTGDSDEKAELMTVYADELWAMRKRNTAVDLYKSIYDHAVEPYSKNALKKIALHYERRKLKGYDGYLEKYAKAYPGDQATEYFLWLLGRLNIKNNNRKAAASFLEAAVKGFPDGEYTDRCRFWLYKIYKADSNSKWESLFTELITRHLNSSYTWNALRRRQTVDTSELKKDFSAALKQDKQMKALQCHTLLFYSEKSFKKRNRRLSDLDNKRYEQYKSLYDQIKNLKISSKHRRTLDRLELYFRIGDRERITRELALLPNTEDARKDRSVALAHWGDRYGNSFLTVHSILELLKIEKLHENIAIMPEKLVTMLFPTPFEKCIDTYSREYDVKKNLLYAVIKAESLFNHTAVSPAGAVGLMQFMPATGRGLARQLKLKSYDLKDPCTSIRFGAKYLAWLNRTFDSNFIYIMSGYNAGAGNVNKWKKKQRFTDPDYMTEFTPYIETRYYILRTGKFRDQYGIIYPSLTK